MRHRIAFALAILFASYSLFTARSAHADLSAAERAKVEKILLHRVFPGPSTDSPLACAWESNQVCVPGAMHLTAVPTAAVPTLAACQAHAAGTTVQSCYQAAVGRLQWALDNGDVLAFFEAAYRARDVIAWSRQAGVNAPAWLKQEGPQNFLWAFYNQHGLPLPQLGACYSTVADTRYTCLGTLPRPIFRAALAALDEHNAILVRNNRLTGARNRTLAIFKGATAPMTIAMVQRGSFDPALAQGAPFVHELGRYFFLRAYESQLGNAGVNGEVNHLNTLLAYKPADLAAAPPMHLMLFAAHRGAGRWNPQTDSLQILDGAIHADRLELQRLIEWTRALGGVRNLPGMMNKAARLRRAADRTFITSNYDLLASQGWRLPFHDAAEDSSFTVASMFSDPCGWVSMIDILRTIRLMVIETRTERFIDAECWEACQSCQPQPVCEIECIDACTVERTVTEVHWVTQQVSMGEDLDMESIRDGYRDLMNSNYGSPYDPDDDGHADLNYNDASSATIVNSGVWSGNATEGCFAELDTLNSEYSTGLDIDEETLTADFGIYAADFVPYPIAARICPAYTRFAVGLDGDDHRLSSVNVIPVAGGGSIWLPFTRTCETPWSYTQAVARFLDDPAMADARAEMAVDLPSNETVATTVADFASEALLLSVPVAGAFQQRADLAYVAGEVPDGSTDPDAWYDAHSGLANLATRLDRAADPVGRGLDLAVEIATSVTGIAGASGPEAMAAETRAALATCGSGSGCADNSPAHVRALFYKRLRDALDLYQRNATTRFEVVHRRLDGALSAACLTATDADTDGIPDGFSCASTSDCTDVCEGLDDAAALVDGAASDLGGVRDALTAQAALLTDPTLATFVTSLAAYADGIVADLDRRERQLYAGIDWLGDRPGRWVPRISVDAETDLNSKLAELDATSSVLEYETFIDDYLARIGNIGMLADAHDLAATEAQSQLAGYCSDDAGAADLDGCGMDATWDASEDLVQQVNREIRQYLCEPTITLYYADPHDADGDGDEIEEITETLDLTAPGLADHVALMGAMGFVDGCPQLVAPSFDSLDINEGSVAEQLAALERQLFDVELALSAIANETELMTANSLAAAEMGGTLANFARQQINMERMVDALLCTTAIVGSVIMCAAITYGTAGALAAACVPAVSGAVAACAALADDEFFPGHITPHELQLAYHEYSVALLANAEIAALAADTERLLASFFDYGLAAMAYRGAQADFARAITVADEAMANLYDDPAFDPTAWMFEDQDFESMKGRFIEFVGDVREVHRLVEYAAGHAIPEGSTLPLASGDYCLPRLADLTVFKTYGADFDSARLDLRASSCAASLAPSRLNLVAMASVLAELMDDFGDVYGARAEVDPWLIGHGSAAGGIDRDGDGAVTRDDDLIAREVNPGEWALLGDSGFYDPLGYQDVEKVDDGVTCPTGQIDLHDLCDHFTSGQKVKDDTCFDPTTLDEAERIDLAYLDHMLRGEGIETFACTRSGSAGSYIYGVAAATTGYFTFADLGGEPAWLNTTDGTEHWFRDIPQGITTGYYQAQTRTVRDLYVRLFDTLEAATPIFDGTAPVSPEVLNRYPGTFVFRFDVSSPLGGQDDTTSLFDMERDLLSGAEGSTSTMAEQLVSLALVCTDDYACADPTPHSIDMILLGTSYQGDRYLLPSGRQEQVAYAMTPWAMVKSTGWSARITDVVSGSAEITAMLDNPAVQTQFARLPLHVDGFFMAIDGVVDANGGQYRDALANVDSQWGLYRTESASVPASRIRIKARYSYYGTSAGGGASYRDLIDMLPCMTSSAALISDPTEDCTVVSPY